MNSGRDKMRLMDAEDDDRLSGLPDDVILKILSLVGLKDAIKTSVLSSRWRFMWTSMPQLIFSSDHFFTKHKFSNFVTHVLSRRNNQAHLSSVKLYIRGKDDQDVAQRIMNHAFSLSGQQLNVTCLYGSITSLFEKNIVLSLSGSKTLKHLTLSTPFGYDRVKLTSTREFSSLTTLHLDCITLYDGFFSNCPNLENLSLCWCHVRESNVFRICHSRLSNLTLDTVDTCSNTINVVTPQLKNLIVLNYFGRYQISAPRLASLLFRGHCPPTLSTDGFPDLENAQLSLHNLHRSHAPRTISLLQKLHNVKVLSLSVEIIQLLNSSVELIKSSPFGNLKSLKIDSKVDPKVVCLRKHEHMRVIMSTEVKKYLLNGSSKATVTEVYN